MRVFVAGASGAIGEPLVRHLLAKGHVVIGTTRSTARAEKIRALGAEACVLDAYDQAAVRKAVAASKPDAVMHQLTALPVSVTRKNDMVQGVAETARIRRETIGTFAEAARDAGAKRFIAQSISFVTKPEGPQIHDETAPLFVDGCPDEFRETIDAVKVVEEVTTRTEGITGIALRYGYYYGGATWYAKGGTITNLIAKRRYPIIGNGNGLASFVHIDDAVDATERALTLGESGIYNITDDEPVKQRDWLPQIAALLGAKTPFWVPAWLARLAVGPTAVHYATTLRGASNAKAKRAFAWTPRSRSDGFREVFAEAQ